MPRANQLSLPELSVSAQKASKAKWNGRRQPDEADFFTIGYSGHSFDSFLSRLHDVGVRTVVDIRFHAVSLYKPDFNARVLEQRLAVHDIDYLHLPNLGVPRDIRARAVGKATRRSIWAWYEDYVVKRYAEQNLHWFFNAGEHPVAFLCVELDPLSCHRHVLAEALARQGLEYFDL